MEVKYKCKECGNLVLEVTWGEELNQKLIDRQLCFDCLFWVEKINAKNSSRVVRVAGEHYWIGPEKRRHQGEFRGFAGQFWCIEFYDGRKIKTTNLWYNGVIPFRFKERLPDNASFIEKESRSCHNFL